MAELIEMQFGMLSWLVPGNIITWECRRPYRKRHFRGVWPI